MIYDEVEDDLLKFVEHPVTDIGYISSKICKLSFLTKTLLCFPFLRKYISHDDSVKIFINIYHNFLKTTQRDIELLKPIANNTTGFECLEKYAEKLKEYFRVGIYYKNLEEITIKEEKIASLFIENNLITKLEYNCNRITESLNLSEEYFYSIVSNKNIWLSYFLSEIYLLLVNKSVYIKIDKNDMFILPTEKLNRRLKNFWLSEILEASSKMTDRHLYNLIAPHFNKKRISTNDANNLIDQILDKIFSIKVEYLPVNLKESEEYKILREIIYFSIKIEFSNIIGNKFHPKKYLKKDENICKTTLDFIDGIIIKEQDITLKDENAFIYKDGFDNYYRGPLGFKYGIKKLVGASFEKLEKNNFRSSISNSFDVDYIFNYIKNLDYFGYKPYGEFKAKNNAKIEGYDVDLVLHDEKNDNYYFFQIKYKFSALPTYLSEQCRFFNEANFKKGYAKQLTILKENFNHESIRKKLKDHGLEKATDSNSHFILLHNLPFLNFYEYEGIHFYEWNLLRNILQDGKIFWYRDKDSGSVNSNSKFHLHQMDDIVKSYFENSVHGGELEKVFNLYMNTYCFFKMGDYDLKFKML